MESLRKIVGGLQDNTLFFWLGAVLGFLVILGTHLALKAFLKNKIKHKRTLMFSNTMINWATLLMIILYFFTYFSQQVFLYKTIFILGTTEITIFLILSILFLIILAIKFSKSVRQYILPIVYDKYELDKATRTSMSSFFHYLIALIAILVSLSTIGFNLSSLAVFGSVLGVGIGFGFQNVMSDFISGLIILFERPIKVGDRVIIDNKIADIEEIKLRATIVLTRANERLIIPNSYFLEEKFVNRSYADKHLRIALKVDVAYGSDVELVKELLLKSVIELKEESWPSILMEPSPRVYFEEFGESGLHFSVWFWIDSQDDEKEFKIPSDLRFRIMKKFKENKIEIPFPQQDVHLISKST